MDHNHQQGAWRGPSTAARPSKWEGAAQSLAVPSTDSERHALKRAAQLGQIQRVDRGLYLVNPNLFTPHHDLAAVAIRRPDSVICLESAAVFHGMTSTSPGAIQIAIPRSTHPPTWQYPAIEAIVMPNEQLQSGIETHTIEGVSVRITSAARTLADCLKHERRIGAGRFQEILWTAWKGQKASTDDIMQQAQAIGVGPAMKLCLRTIQGA